jgi:hypothetical protein
MRRYGLTKARSMGPVAEMVERAGGSLARVFRSAELPLRLIDEPDCLILLKDQFNLVECAAREVGDEALAARLSTEAGFASLGAYGKQIDAMPRLDQAIASAIAKIGPLLQSSTRFSFTVAGGFANWSYGVNDPIEVGRQKNEMLALGYMLDLVRRFAGPGFTPLRLEIGGPPLAAKAAAETVFRCDISRAETAAIVFPADLLEAPNPRASPRQDLEEAMLPDPSDIVACAEHLIGLALLEERPSVEWAVSALGNVAPNLAAQPRRARRELRGSAEPRIFRARPAIAALRDGERRRPVSNSAIRIRRIFPARSGAGRARRRGIGGGAKEVDSEMNLPLIHRQRGFAHGFR